MNAKNNLVTNTLDLVLGWMWRHTQNQSGSNLKSWAFSLHVALRASVDQHNVRDSCTKPHRYPKCTNLLNCRSEICVKN